MSTQDKITNFLGALHRIKDTSGSIQDTVIDTFEMMTIYLALGYTIHHFKRALTMIQRKTDNMLWQKIRRIITFGRTLPPVPKFKT